MPDSDAPSSASDLKLPCADWSEVDELIRVSDRLRHRSYVVQIAAARAGVVFRKAVQRSIEVCGK